VERFAGVVFWSVRARKEEKERAGKGSEMWWCWWSTKSERRSSDDCSRLTAVGRGAPVK
jgi:hypothetical protein